MRWIIGISIIALMMCANGCSSTDMDLIWIEVKEVEDDALTLLVKTEVDVVQFKRTSQSTCFLCYSVDENKYVNSIATDASIDPRPFSAELIGSVPEMPDVHRRYSAHLTEWRIPLADDSHISGRIYYYDLDDGDEHRITFEFMGGQMLLGRMVESDPFTLGFTQNNE